MKGVPFFNGVRTLKALPGLELCLISVKVQISITVNFIILTSSRILKAGNMFENMSLCSAHRSYHLKSLNLFSFSLPIYH
jgi:hypothetical protein